MQTKTAPGEHIKEETFRFTRVSQQIFRQQDVSIRMFLENEVI
jgi:hypothetical protein